MKTTPTIQLLFASMFKKLFAIAAFALSVMLSAPAFAQQSVSYDFVRYGGANQTWVVEAGAMLQVEVHDDATTPENDVFFTFRNNIFTELGYLSSIVEVEIDTGTVLPGMFNSVSIWAHSEGVRYTQYTPCTDPVTLLCGDGRIAWSGDYAFGGLANSGPKIDGVNPGEFVTLRAILGDGVSYADVLEALRVGMSKTYVDGPANEWTIEQRDIYRAGAAQGLRFAMLVQSIVPNSWHPDGHGLFVTHNIVTPPNSGAPQISGVFAFPSSILDNETSQLSVAANDPDGGPQPLSYQWEILSGGGMLDMATSATPVYTPADVVGTQTVSLRVTVSDGETAVSEGLTLTVEDASPPPPGSVLLENDFSVADLSGWTVRDEGTISAPSKWQVKSGELAQLSNIQDGGTSSALPHLGTYLLYDEGLGWTDYRFKLKLRSTDDDTLGVMFRYIDNGNYYRFSWDKQRSQRRLVKKSGGVFTLLAADNVPYVMGQAYQVEIVVLGDQLEVWIDGTRIFQVADPSHRRGSVAFHTWMNNAAYFDDLAVEDLSGGNFNAIPKITAVTAEPAHILDNGISNLTVVASDPDDGPQALSYQWTIVSGGGVLDNATSATPIYSPADIVGMQTVTLKVEVSDGEATVAGNLTLTVEDANPPPLGPQLLFEDFSGGTLAGWTVRDEGTISAPSKWQVKSGELAQLSNIQDGGRGNDLPHLGTYLLYNQGTDWTDYRAKFKLRSMDDDTLGLMFRVSDNDNYYRFSWDKQRNYRRLVKRVGGVFTLLAADNVPYVQGQNHTVEIVADGTSLEVWIDGARVFQVVDGAHAQGSVAFHTWMNNGAYFDDIQVNAIE